MAKERNNTVQWDFFLTRIQCPENICKHTKVKW